MLRNKRFYMAMPYLRASLCLLLFILPHTVVFAQGAKSDTSVVMTGLGINRNKLIQAIDYFAFGLHFKQDKDVKHQPNFTAATEDGEQVQLIGTENGLVLAKWTYTILKSNSTNTRCFNRMNAFMLYMAGQDGVNWFKERLKEISDIPTNLQLENKTFNGGRYADFTYNPGSKILLLVFTPAK